MSEYLNVEKPFLDQLATLGWEVVDQECGIIPTDPAASLRTSTVFMDTDAGRRIKVVSRYQQYRAARKIVERLRAGATPEARSGVVWHTQGSGKSLTMVFVARMIRVSADLQDLKLVLVNDRVDLEQQLARTARLIGGKVNVISSTAELREHLSTDASDLNMVMVHKFSERVEALTGDGSVPSSETFGVVNPSERILLMIDEAHCTQGSELGDSVFEAFPNATRIAFTGTPLITEQHGARRTVKRFGDYIDTYKLMRDRDRPLLFPAMTVAPGGECSGRAMGWRGRLNLSP